MQTLSDLLSANQASPAQPQTTGTDPGYEERKSGWKKALDSMVQDPVNAMMMLQFGSSLASIQPGESVGAAVSNAFTDAFSMRGRYEQILRERQAAEAEAQAKQKRFELDEKRVGYEGERIAVDREGLNFRREDATENRKLEREKLAQRRREAEQAAKTGSGTSATKPSELDKLTQALVEERGMTESAARILANQMDKKQTREDKILTLANGIITNSLDPKLTVQDAMAQATERVDALYGAPAQEGGGSLEQHPGWDGIRPEVRAEMMRRVQAGEASMADLEAFLNERAGGQ